MFSCQPCSCFRFLRITYKKLYVHCKFMLELPSQRWYDSTFPEASCIKMWWIKTTSCIVVCITAMKTNSVYDSWLLKVDRHSTVVPDFCHEWTAIGAKTVLFFWGSEERKNIAVSSVWIKFTWKLILGMECFISKILVKILLNITYLCDSEFSGKRNWFYLVPDWFLDLWDDLIYIISHAS